MEKIYLDYAATTPLHPEVMEKMCLYLEKIYGNPSSLYRPAQEARGAVEEARERVAALINSKEEEIVFTSGGTESDNLAIKGIAWANRKKGNHIITTKIEHPAVLNTCRWLEKQGFEVTYLDVDKYGVVDLNMLEDSLKEKTILVSIMHANNEIGTIQPLEEIAQIVKKTGIYFHTDAVQTVGNIQVDVERLGVDLLSLSAHKFYGPKGVGALYIRKGTRIDPLIHGGHQEKDLRAGTENVAGIVGLGEAAQIALREGLKRADKIKKLRDMLYRIIKEKVEGIILNGHPEKRVPGILNICVRYVEGESMLINLDLEGIYVSSGSACASASLEPSHVLKAIGVPSDLIHGALRFSIGRETTEKEILKVGEVFTRIVEK
ncbi:cysteine desulfurase NifS, partial [Candidatus Aerophobetes bacterium]|nr:cysteine desulfurase NifS [Candidatus Aerophobetes bacterium]